MAFIKSRLSENRKLLLWRQGMQRQLPLLKIVRTNYCMLKRFFCKGLVDSVFDFEYISGK